MERAKVIKVALDKDIENFEKERKDLEEALKEAPGTTLDFSDGDQRLAMLAGDRTELEKYRDGLRDSAERENDPDRLAARQKWEQAKGCERDTDYDKAIKLFEQAQQVLNDPGLATHIKKLKEVWKPKSEEHKKARDFIYS